MSGRRTDLHKLREAIRLHRLGCSKRSIANRLKVSRNTLRPYLEAFEKAGILDGPVDDLPCSDTVRAAIDDEVKSPLPPSQVSTVERWRETIEALREKGVGPTATHDRLRLQEPDYEGSLSAVKRMFRRLKREEGPRETDVAIPVETDPGEIAQVDFGYAGKRYDPERGMLRKTWVFVMTLGFSRHMFCQLVFDQKVETWIQLHIEAFEYFGCVPRVIVPDNLKAAIVRAAFGVDEDAAIQRSYRELAQHYGFQIDPTPPRSPEKKGKVEAGVRYVKGNILCLTSITFVH